MILDVAGQRIVVTGGAQGIGSSVVRALVGEGADVAILDVAEERGRQVATDARRAGPGTATFSRCDVGRRTDVERELANVAAEFGGLDALVHVAGVQTRAPAQELTDQDWDAVLDVNLRGAFLTNQAVFPHLRDAGGGRILNFGSGAGLEPFPGAAHYSAAKAGIAAWSRTVAHEWGSYGIAVNTVVPAMWTPMYDTTRDGMTADQLATHDALMRSKIPLGGTLGQSDRDLAPVLVFLLSEAARFITGQIIAIDGGLSTVR